MSKNGKRIFATLCAIVVFISSYANFIIPFQSYAAENETAPILDLEKDVKYFGRTYSENNKRYISWSNSGFQFTFYGTGAQATLQASLNTPGNAKQQAYINVYVDGELYQNGVIVPESESTVTLASGLKKGLHTIKVLKRTSSYYSMVTLSKIQLDAGSEIRETQKDFEKKMLFIGDNLTAGYASLQATYTATDPGTPMEDSTISYTALAADYFGAENMTVALTHEGGRGILQNGNKTTTGTAPQFFEYVDSRTKTTVQYDHSQYDPDIIVINLGSYELESGAVTAAQFKPACKNFILQVRAAYPNVPILYTYGIVNNGYSGVISEAITELNNAGDKKIYYRLLSTITSDAQRGYNKHPSTSSHVKYSQELIAAVEDIMDWKGVVETPKNPVSADSQLDTKYDTFEKTDISVMSYNVLAHNSTYGTLESQTTRKAKVVKMIATYNPDIIGIQEAAVETALDWAAYLATELPKLGYGVYSLKGTSPMTIGNGLMIFYKTNRFSEFTDDGFKGAAAYSDGSGRYFHWITLRDKTTGQQVMVYNTHFHVGTTDADHTKRNTEATDLYNHIIKTKGDSKASRYAVFVTGDFNADFTGSYATCMNTLHDSFLDDAATVADYTRFAYPKEEIDHIFVNSNYVDVKEYHVAIENVDGRRTSDHSPQIAYCNFKTPATIDGKDISDRRYEASTTASTYTFNVKLSTRADYEIYDENNNLLTTIIGAHTPNASDPFTVNLAKEVNRFYIKFYDGDFHSSLKGNYVCTVEAIITKTSASKPSLAPSGAINSYFANGAYHILVNDSTTSLSLSASGATFHATAGAIGNAITSVALNTGRTVCYLKTTAGDIYPVYIYKQTATADSSAIYVDDDIPTGENGEQVAFSNGKDVIFVTRGTNGVTTVAEAAEKANAKANSTVYFAPGNYTANTTANTIVFNQNVTLLGNNHSLSPIKKLAPNWVLANRNEETVINGGLIFQNQSNISITVKGFSFKGTSNYGPICLLDTSAAATCVTHIQTLDIQNNIFTGSGNGSVNGASALRAFSGAQVKGLVKNNYFRCTVNQKAKTADWVAGQTRGLSIKNANGLEFTGNYFRGYELLGDFTDEISSSVAGNLNYAFVNNRFEHCGTIRSAIKNIQSNTSANIVYYNNDVIRCGPGRRQGSLFFMDFDFNEGSLGNVCSNISISVRGNRFADCYRVFTIQRTLGAGTGNLAQIKFNLNNNSFINPTEGDWDGHEFFVGRFNFYTTTSKTANVVVDWDLSGNSFTSAIFNDSATITRINAADAAEAANKNRPLRNYRTDIPELNYIWNATKEDSAIAPIKIDTNTFKAKTPVAYYTIADDFAAVLNKAIGVVVDKDYFNYNFDDESIGAELTKNEMSSSRDKMVFGVNTAGTDSISITKDNTLELKGRTSFYTENSWNSVNQIEFELYTTATNVDSNRSAFHFKFDHWLSVANRALKNSDFYSGSAIEGCFITFATVNGVPTIKLFVSYKTSTGTKSTGQYVFENVVENLAEFNNFKLIEKDGTIDFYANDVRFARLQCYDNASTTATTYYDNIDVYAVENGALVKKGTVTNTLVTKATAIAFATSNANANTVGNATYGQTLELDNLIITTDIESTYEFKIDGVQLLLSDEINIRFVVNKENFDNAGYTQPAVTATFGKNTYQLQGTAATISEVSYYVFICENVSPHMMGETISATLSANLNGTTVESTPTETSIASYVYKQLETTTDTKLRTLLVDMLHYGAKAQLYTRYNKAYLVDADLTAEQASWGTQTLRELTSVASSPDFNGDATWLGMGLNLENKVKIQGYFSAASTAGLQVKVTNSTGKVIQTLTESNLKVESTSNGISMISFIFDKLSVRQMSDAVSFTVYNSQGTNISGTITYSIESYAQRNQNSTNSVLVNLLNAMIIYGDAAKAYVG